MARNATSASNRGSEGNVRAMTATRMPCTSSHSTITRLRLNRSLIVPVNGPSSAGAKSAASSNSATANAWPLVFAVYSSRVTKPSESPRKEILRAHHSDRKGWLLRKSRSAPAPLPPGSVSTPPPLVMSLLGHAACQDRRCIPARSPVNLRCIMGKGSYNCKQFGATILPLGRQGTFIELVVAQS